MQHMNLLEYFFEINDMANFISVYICFCMFAYGFMKTRILELFLMMLVSLLSILLHHDVKPFSALHSILHLDIYFITVNTMLIAKLLNKIIEPKKLK